MKSLFQLSRYENDEAENTGQNQEDSGKMALKEVPGIPTKTVVLAESVQCNIFGTLESVEGLQFPGGRLGL